MFHHAMYFAFLKYTYLIYKRKEIGFYNFLFYGVISNYEYTLSQNVQSYNLMQYWKVRKKLIWN